MITQKSAEEGVFFVGVPSRMSLGPSFSVISCPAKSLQEYFKRHPATYKNALCKHVTLQMASPFLTNLTGSPFSHHTLLQSINQSIFFCIKIILMTITEA
jgi:hypothetical protein